MDYKLKYLKYKNKYLELKQIGGTKCMDYGFQQHTGECWHDALAMLFLQSDLIKDTFIDNIRNFNLDKIKIKFSDLFSRSNIDSNIHLLPNIVQQFYNTKVKANREELHKIYKFLEYCYEYCKNFQKRAIRRLDFDKEIRRYDITEFELYDPVANKEFVEETKAKLISKLDPSLPEDIKQKRIEKELKIIIAEKNKRVEENNRRTKLTKHEKKIKLKRRGSFTEARICPTEIMKIIALLNVEEGDADYYGIINKRGGNTRTVELVIDILKLFFLNQNNVDMIVADVDDKDFFVKLKEIIDNPKLIGVHISVINKKSDRHAISVYKCDTTELLYDDELTRPYPFTWATFFKNVITQSDSNIFFVESDYYTKKYGIVFEDDIDNIIYREALDYKLNSLDNLVTDYNDIKQDYISKKITLEEKNEYLLSLYSRPFSEIINDEENTFKLYKIIIIRGIILKN